MAPGEPEGTPGQEAEGLILPDHQYGRGTYDPATGLWEWYELPADRQGDGQPITWAQLLEQWPTIAADLLDVYGVDVWDRRLMRHRPWPWLRGLVRGLLAADTRIARLLARPPGQSR